jgi:uncharacterized protein YfkK (UPF0435 family)
MKNREIVVRKIENIEGKLKQLRFHIQRSSTLEEYLDTLTKTEEDLYDLKTIIDREPLSNSEMNPNL